jgi:hypothetical protein
LNRVYGSAKPVNRKLFIVRIRACRELPWRARVGKHVMLMRQTALHYDS